MIALGISDVPAPNTIAKYIPETRKSPTEKQKQSWKTFLKNHSEGIWAMDFMGLPSITFKVLYVLLIVSHDRRKIKHFAVTANPSSKWVVQQIREATPFGEVPNYLLHDNDAIFRAKSLQNFLANAHIKSKRTAFHSPWQNGLCERLVGMIRQELLDHIIPINERYLERLLKEYINYYNTVRTHQTLNGQTPVMSDKPLETTVENTILVSEPILGGLYQSYQKAA